MLTLFWFIVVITIVVFFHELGHFIFAKLFKTKVEEFSIGMGPKLFSYKGKETEFRFNLIPIGGYVKIAGEEIETDELSDDPNLFYNKKPWQKFLIAFAGPLFSIILGYIVLSISGILYGFPEVKIEETIKDSPAYYAGIQPGDVIKKVNGNIVFDSSILSLAIKEGKELNLDIIRNGENINLNIIPKLYDPEYTLIFKSDYDINLNSLYIKSFNMNPPEKIKDILPNLEKGDRLIIELENGVKIEGKLEGYTISPKRYAIGVYFATFSNTINKDISPFQANDIIKNINGIKINNGLDLIKNLTSISMRTEDKMITILNNKIIEFKNGFDSENLKILVSRNGKDINITLNKSEFLKILQEPAVLKFAFDKWRPKGFEIITVSIQWANTLLKAMIDTIGQLFTGKVKTTEVMGPVGIAGIVGQAAKAGPEALISLIALITLNLGIINLLPIPALDGGRIVFSIYEMITGKRTNPKVEAMIHTIGFLILMGLFVYFTYNDILRFFR
ncbi:regulator of sigma E protease [Marinitoga hydrogenitolerans DSM 16785]|uniref:Regulator of sigma E protease n=1 Tax=Marinitoga hydrogenitolerans (strain DSM 16785 / JCM 12826 / AT1271) TaxID=1122195 RepID=A0A1M5ACP4_MARH1|nr:site-2 protease family protein [Marinitoga hydrogenitolerans]SHF27955.1 regulator of sigma E protease [Marinitoga hydrogenitolerans DSM 16785]